MTKKEQFWGLIYLVLDLLILPTLITFSLQLLFPACSEAALNFGCFLFHFLCVCVIFRRFLWGSVKALSQSGIRIAVTAVLGLCSYFVLTRLVTVLIYTFLPEFFNINDSSVNDLLKQNFPLMAFGTVFLVPVTEELLYRGLVFGSFLKKSPVLAYLISVPLFCAIHVVPYIGQYDFRSLLACFIQYIPAGICLGWAYHKSGSIASPILIHAIINAIGIAAVR